MVAAGGEQREELLKIYAQLRAMNDNLPQKVYSKEHFVGDQHTALNRLEKLGFQVGEFRIPEEQLLRRLTSSNYLTGEETYSEKRSVEREFMSYKLQALLGYFTLTTDDRKSTIGFHGSCV